MLTVIMLIHQEQIGLVTEMGEEYTEKYRDT